MSLGKPLTEILVKDLMSKALISVEPETTVFQVAKMMNEGGIGAVLVKKNDTTSGIITDRDFAIKIATQKLALDTPVDRVASYPLEIINSDQTILAAAKQMTVKKIRKLGVAEGGKIVGIITSTDLVNKLANS